MVFSPKGPVSYPHYKVVWVYCGAVQEVPEMYDRPYKLCRWWIREHARDAQYARGKFKIVSMTTNRTFTS